MLTFLDIAKFILPGLISIITDRNTIKNAGTIVDKIENTVKTVTGASTPEDAQKKITTDPTIEADLKAKLTDLALEAQKADYAADEAFNARANANTDRARDTLLELLNKPESQWVAITPSIISYIVVVNFFALLILMIFSNKFFPDNEKIVQIINILVGAAAAGFATVLNFWLGSSLGSRSKDSSIALGTTVDKVKSLIEDKPQPPSGGAPPPPGGSGGSGGSGSSGSSAGPPPSGTGSAPPAGSDGTRAQLPPLPEALNGVGRSTAPATMNRLQTIPYNGVDAPIRYNNPGSQWPNAAAAAFGQTGYGALKDGNRIANFPSPINGAAANFDLLARKYVGKTIYDAGRIWTGDHAFGIPGYSNTDILSKEMLGDPKTAIPLLKAIAKRESGKQKISDEQWAFAYGMFSAGSADAFLAKFGHAPTTPVEPVQPEGRPRTALEALIADALVRNQYTVARGPGEINIVYIEGMDLDGSPNNNEANRFNDLRCVIDFQTDGTPRMLGKWQATTEPGYYYDRDHPINEKGAARIKFGQYRAWQVGLHHKQEALRQVGDVTVCRDLNRDMQRTGDTLDTGLFGINQHGGYDMPEDDVGKASAGCLVGRLVAGHEAFMAIVKQDPRYRADNTYIFDTAIFPAAEIVAAAAIG